jgi:acyl-coenzyme A synthetase/AMP-(fatty) acid ligase
METVIARILRNAEANPGALAFVDGEGRYTYGELCRPVNAAAAWLYRSGVRAGDVVALSLSASDLQGVRSVRALYALACLGAVVLPLYPDVPLMRRRELMMLLGARWIVTREPRESAPDCPAIDPETFGWDGAAAGGGAAPRGDAPDRPFVFHFSGGTTGMPKAMLFDNARYLQNALSSVRSIGADAADRMVSSRPWPTLPGLRHMLRMHVVGGAFINLPCPETREELEALIHRVGVTILVVSPWQLRRLLASAPPAAPRAQRLKVLYTAGGAVSPAELSAARAALTPNVYVTYASTESGVLAIVRPQDPGGPPGYCGKLVPGVEGRVTDDAGLPVAPGQSGHLGFRSPWIPERYASNEKATAGRFRDGWYYPGDIGMIDGEGRVTVLGRADDAINYGGVKVMPADTEAVLAQHPEVADAALVGVPHAMAGTVPVALLVLRSPVDEAALAAWYRARLDGSQVPVAFVRVPEIIRSADGKILRKAMIEKYRLSAE